MSSLKVFKNRRKLECFICKNCFLSLEEPIIHYTDENNKEEAVSLCDNCTKAVLSLFHKFKDKQPQSGDEVLINVQGKLLDAIYYGCGMFYDLEGEKYFESDWINR